MRRGPVRRGTGDGAHRRALRGRVGLSDATCELPSHGWVTAAHAREIMTAPGSVWQSLAVDVDSGRALELFTDCYRPTQAMVDHVRAVDGVCRRPG